MVSVRSLVLYFSAAPWFCRSGCSLNQRAELAATQGEPLRKGSRDSNGDDKFAEYCLTDVHACLPLPYLPLFHATISLLIRKFVPCGPLNPTMTTPSTANSRNIHAIAYVGALRLGPPPPGNLLLRRISMRTSHHPCSAL